jgi:hypothetical protein
MILFQFSILDSEEPLPGDLPGTGLQLSERALNGGDRGSHSGSPALRRPLRNKFISLELPMGARRCKTASVKFGSSFPPIAKSRSRMMI